MNDLAMSVPVWAWLTLTGVIATMLAVDLFVHRDNHMIGFREAAVWSGVWIAAGLGFGAALWLWQGGQAAEA